MVPISHTATTTSLKSIALHDIELAIPTFTIHHRNHDSNTRPSSSYFPCLYPLTTPDPPPIPLPKRTHDHHRQTRPRVAKGYPAKRRAAKENLQRRSGSETRGLAEGEVRRGLVECACGCEARGGEVRWVDRICCGKVWGKGGMERVEWERCNGRWEKAWIGPAGSGFLVLY
jgi:hypothetical protein